MWVFHAAKLSLFYVSKSCLVYCCTKLSLQITCARRPWHSERALVQACALVKCWVCLMQLKCLCFKYIFNVLEWIYSPRSPEIRRSLELMCKMRHICTLRFICFLCPSLGNKICLKKLNLICSLLNILSTKHYLSMFSSQTNSRNHQVQLIMCPF